LDVIGLIPEFGGLLWTVLAFVVALSVIVAVHEYGHYIVGRLSGIKAEVFSLGFGPVLWSRKDRHGTRWQVAALPFGGFVKFLGDSNAASGADAETIAEIHRRDPGELRHTLQGAPLWARTVTVAAGPVFNFALSIVVFTAIFMLRGVASDPLTVGELPPLPAGHQQLQPGDQILGIGGVPAPEFGNGDQWLAFTGGIAQQPTLDYQIRRDGSDLTVQGPYPFPPLVAQVSPRSAAVDSGLQAGDVISGIDGQPIFAFDQLKAAVESSDGQPLLLDVWRQGQAVQFTLAPRRTDEPQPEGGFRTVWRIGIAGGMAIVPATEAAGPVEALGSGLAQTYAIIAASLSGLWHMITGAISTCNISGPLGIAETSGAMASQGAQSFIWFIAVLSTAVGLLNLFPIPALDGGHLVFYAYEAIAGKPPSDKVLRVLMAIGVAMILSLMVFSLSNDLFC
jgi:regulator of sigma E protease